MTKNKNNRVIRIFLVTVIALVSIMVLAFVFIPKSDHAFADDEARVDYIYYVDGAETTEAVLRRGDSVSFTVGYDEEILIPTLVLSCDDYAVHIDENRLSLNDDSIIGGILYVFLSVCVDDKEVLLDTPIEVYPTLEKDFTVSQTVGEGGYIISGDFAEASARLNMQGTCIEAVLKEGDGISDFMSKKHVDSYGNIEVAIVSITLIGRNNVGSEMPFTIHNGSAGLNVPVYGTNSMMSGGSGTSNDPYLVSNATDFGNIYSLCGNNVYFRQTADINLSGSTSLNTHTFYGHYDGQHNDLKYINTVFTVITIDNIFCQINNGIIENVDLLIWYGIFTASTFGGICSGNSGTIDDCVVGYKSNIFMPSTGDGAWFGGISYTNTGTISDCNIYFDQVVFSKVDQFGGITVLNGGTISGGITIEEFNITISNMSWDVIGGLVSINLTNGYISVSYLLIYSMNISYQCSASLYPYIGFYGGSNSAARSHYSNIETALVNLTGYSTPNVIWSPNTTSYRTYIQTYFGSGYSPS